MSDRPAVGINVQEFHGDGDPLQLARWCEGAGYESVWLTDGGGGYDALTMAGAIAASTRRVRIGLSVIPVYTRPAAVLATSAAALARLAPGRVVFGVGSSSRTMIDDWYGIPFDKPLTRVRETVELLRGMLSGAKSDYRGETIRSRNFRLRHPPADPVPVYLAALGPKMLELAGEVADGVILNLVPLRLLPRIVEHLDVGAKRAGRRAEDLEIAALFNTFVTEDIDGAMKRMRAVALRYYSTGVYNNYLEWLGYEREAAAIREGFARGDRDKTAAALGDELVQQLGVIGSAEGCRQRLREYAAGGLDTAIVQTLAEDPTDHQATLEAFRANLNEG